MATKLDLNKSNCIITYPKFPFKLCKIFDYLWVPWNRKIIVKSSLIVSTTPNYNFFCLNSKEKLNTRNEINQVKVSLLSRKNFFYIFEISMRLCLSSLYFRNGLLHEFGYIFHVSTHSFMTLWEKFDKPVSYFREK